MIKTTFTDFYQFIKNPDERQIEINFSTKIRITLLLFLATVIITLAVIHPLWAFIDNLLNLTPAFAIDNLPFLQSFFFLVIIIPFVEELIFRHFLRYQGIKTSKIKWHQWQRIFPFLVYLSAISFGFIHLTNYANSSNWFYILSPFVILSQLLGGFTIAYIRVRLNFLWGVFFHWTWNFLFIITVPAVEEFLKIN
jgi:membrane protease YdiL (CAAX protease family)